MKAEDSLPLLLKHWVEDQYVYFSKVALRDQTKFQRIKKVSYAFFLVGLAMGVIKVVLSPEHPILVAIGIAVVLAALLFGYPKSRALSEHAKRYGRWIAGVSTSGASVIISYAWAYGNRGLVRLHQGKSPKPNRTTSGVLLWMGVLNRRLTSVLQRWRKPLRSHDEPHGAFPPCPQADHRHVTSAPVAWIV
jgi:hypothetical protein